MIYWRFKINGTIVEEPYGWDGATFTLERSKVYHGLDNIYTDEFTFTGVGAELIETEFDTNGCGGSLNFLIEKSCDNSTFETIFEGIINLITYQKLNNEVTVNIEPSNFERIFKNRLDMPVDLLQSVSVDGDTINTIDPVTVRLHSKEILFETKWELPELLPDDSGICADILGVEPNAIFDWTIFIPDGNSNPQWAVTINPAFDKITEEHEKTFNIGIFSPDYRGPEVSDFPIYVGNYLYKNDSLVTSTIALSLRLKFYSKNKSMCGIDLLENDQAYIYYSIINSDNTQASEINLYFRDAVTNPFPVIDEFSNEYTFQVDLTDTRTLTILPNQRLYLQISRYSQGQTDVFATNTDFSPQISFWFDEANCTLQLVENDKSLPSDCKGFYVYEAFSKISSLITGQNDCFRSDYFSRVIPEMQPTAYTGDTQGKGWMNLITQGLLIRNMKQSNGTDYPFQMSFKDLFDAMDCRYNLGINIETVGGNKYIRVEPKYYFYSTFASGVEFENVSDIKDFVNTDVIYNVFNTGYQKWQMNIAKINGIDEFNSRRIYKCVNKNANKALDRVCQFIASGYLIEFTRREQFRKVPTSTFETDNEKFIIAVNTYELYSTKYTEDEANTFYEIGTVSEINVGYNGSPSANPTNVLNPSSCYNIRHTPFEMAMCWADYLGITHPIWSYAKTEGNILLSRSYNENSEYNDFGVIPELTNIDSSRRGRILHSQIYTEFECPISFEEFNDIMTNSKKLIEYFCSTGTPDYGGWVSSIKFRPNIDGMATIKLIKDYTL